jgi:hypothetical protein
LLSEQDNYGFVSKELRAALARAEKARAAAVEEENSLVAAGDRQGKMLQESFHKGRSKTKVRMRGCCP